MEFISNEFNTFSRSFLKFETHDFDFRLTGMMCYHLQNDRLLILSHTKKSFMTVLKIRGRRIDPVAAPVLILHHELKNKSIIAKSKIKF